jgi:ATP-dependent Clp protease ATP-binding subunit ClpA
MHEQFTDRARKTLQLANQEAQRFNHEYVGTEHILLGLVKEGSGVAANVLKNLDIDLRKIRREVEKIVQSGPDKVTLGTLPRTPRAKKVIQYSMDEARNFNHGFVGTEHLLLGLLREEDGVAAQVLLTLGVTLKGVRQETLKFVGHNLPSAEAASSRESRLRGVILSLSEEPAVEDLSFLPPEVQKEVRELDDQIAHADEEKEQAVAEQDFERAAHLRDHSERLKKTREAIAGANILLAKDQRLAQRVAQFEAGIRYLVKEQQEAVSAGDFAKARLLRDDLDRLRNEWIDVWNRDE